MNKKSRTYRRIETRQFCPYCWSVVKESTRAVSKCVLYRVLLSGQHQGSGRWTDVDKPSYSWHHKHDTSTWCRRIPCANFSTNLVIQISPIFWMTAQLLSWDSFSPQPNLTVLFTNNLEDEDSGVTKYCWNLSFDSYLCRILHLIYYKIHAKRYQKE